MTSHRSLAATRSKKVSLFEGEPGLTPTRKTYPTRCKPERACLATCLAEAARGTEALRPLGRPLVPAWASVADPQQKTQSCSQLCIHLSFRRRRGRSKDE